MKYFYNFFSPVNIIISFLVILVILLHLLFGVHLKIYKKTITFDRFLHFLGTLTFSLFLYSLFDYFLNPSLNPKFISYVLVLTIGISLGTFFEIVEFIIDSYKNTGHQHGLKDTMIDLIFDFIGAFFASIISIFIF